MPGETELSKLLGGLEPVRHPDTYVFCSLPGSMPAGAPQPLFTFREREGLTIVLLEGEAARLGLSSTYPSAWITLEVHSSLEAVGMLATITKALAEHGISCNAVSAYHHDHLFVPEARGDEVVHLLRSLTG